MPTRKHYLITRYFYHLYNQTLEGFQPFLRDRLAQYFLSLILYYRFTRLKMSYSRFLLLEPMPKKQYLDYLKNGRIKFDILAYAIMPNHFHFLVKQRRDDGITSCFRDTLNSFTKFYNSKHKRKGPLFLPRFKSKPIVTEEHLIHVSRYIHLNPYSAGLIKKIEDTWTYPFSSAKQYLEENNSDIEKRYIMDSGYFGASTEKYRLFVESEAEAGRTRSLTNYSLKWDN